MPAAEPSPASHEATPQPTENARKRKRGLAAPHVANSPAPGDGTETPPVEQLTDAGGGGLSRFDPSKPIPLAAPRPAFISAGDLFLTEGLAMNKQRYRYTDAVEVAPLVFHSQPSAPADYVRVCWEDRSPLVRVSQDGLTVAGDRGFRSARLNVPVREGKWYMEFHVERGGGDTTDAGGRGDAHVRLGWARREAPVNAPIGYDGYSYGYRDKTGDTVTLSRPKPYGKPYGTGDVIGMYISLPPARQPDPEDPHDPAQVIRKRQPVGIRGRIYHESVEYGSSKEMDDLLERPPDRQPVVAAQPVKRGPQARPAGAPTDDPDFGDPEARRASRKGSATVKNLPGSRSRSTKGEQADRDRPLPRLGRNARIAFFVNGECQGTAFQDLFDYRPLRLTAAMRAAKAKEKKGSFKERENPFDDGTLGYYPFISAYNSGRVRINAGPDFAFPPPPDIDAVCDAMSAGEQLPVEVVDTTRTWRPLHERYAEFWEETRAFDVRDDDGQYALARAVREANERNRLEDEKKSSAKERKRLMDQARRARAKGKPVPFGFSKTPSVPPPDERARIETPLPPDDKMDVEPELPVSVSMSSVHPESAPVPDYDRHTVSASVSVQTMAPVYEPPVSPHVQQPPLRTTSPPPPRPQPISPRAALLPPTTTLMTRPPPLAETPAELVQQGRFHDDLPLRAAAMHISQPPSPRTTLRQFQEMHHVIPPPAPAPAPIPLAAPQPTRPVSTAFPSMPIDLPMPVPAEKVAPAQQFRFAPPQDPQSFAQGERYGGVGNRASPSRASPLREEVGRLEEHDAHRSASLRHVFDSPPRDRGPIDRTSFPVVPPARDEFPSTAPIVAYSGQRSPTVSTRPGTGHSQHSSSSHQQQSSSQIFASSARGGIPPYGVLEAPNPQRSPVSDYGYRSPAPDYSHPTQHSTGPATHPVRSSAPAFDPVRSAAATAEPPRSARLAFDPVRSAVASSGGGAAFDPVRSALNEQAQARRTESPHQHSSAVPGLVPVSQNRMQVNSLMIDTGPTGFHPQRADQGRPGPATARSVSTRDVRSAAWPDPRQPVPHASTPLDPPFSAREPRTVRDERAGQLTWDARPSPSSRSSWVEPSSRPALTQQTSSPLPRFPGLANILSPPPQMQTTIPMHSPQHPHPVAPFSHPSPSHAGHHGAGSPTRSASYRPLSPTGHRAVSAHPPPPQPRSNLFSILSPGNAAVSGLPTPQAGFPSFMHGPSSGTRTSTSPLSSLRGGRSPSPPGSHAGSLGYSHPGLRPARGHPHDDNVGPVLSPVYSQSNLRDTSPVSALRAAGGPPSPIAYTESSLRSGAREDEMDDEEGLREQHMPRHAPGVRGFPGWESYGRGHDGRDGDGDVPMRGT